MNENSPAIEPTPAAEPRLHAHNHKPECECRTCARVRHVHALSLAKPPEKRTQTSYKKRKFATELVKNGGNATKAALSAGYSANSAKNLVRDTEVTSFVQTSLRKAGITDDFLATLAKQGMDAFNQRIITDKDGNIVDVVNMPAWRERHSFWRDVLMAKKILGADIEQSSAGGLVIIAPDTARIVSAHPATCVCEDCVSAWQAKTTELRRLAANETAIEIAPTKIEPDTTRDSGMVTEDFSDRK